MSPSVSTTKARKGAAKPFVEYKLLTGEQVERVRGGNDSWARIWMDQVTCLGGAVFEIDGRRPR